MKLHLLKWDVRPVRQCTTWWSWCLLRCVVSHPILSEIRESKKREEVKTPANRSQQTNGFQSHLMCQNQISSKSHILRICEENISVFFESKRQFRNGQGKKHLVSHQPALWKINKKKCRWASHRGPCTTSIGGNNYQAAQLPSELIFLGRQKPPKSKHVRRLGLVDANDPNQIAEFNSVTVLSGNTFQKKYLKRYDSLSGLLHQFLQ